MTRSAFPESDVASPVGVAGNLRSSQRGDFEPDVIGVMPPVLAERAVRQAGC
jgi:hypothetical protein